MGDDHQLKIGLRRTLRHDVAQSFRQGCCVGLIQVSGGLIQRQDAAVQAESLRQCQADDEACQHLHTSLSSYDTT